MADDAFSIDLVGASPKSAALASAETAEKALALDAIRPSAVGALIVSVVPAPFFRCSPIDRDWIATARDAVIEIETPDLRQSCGAHDHVQFWAASPHSPR